ncbi:guanylate kinase [Mycoplasmopsis glycophila]|uniref:Guanylate kinase n=1 Tax=Mycoplasmopsis glycophila TaxID=171285 RepID=A0A449AUR8_9BACT|nr:guanylate kinase [Mycoplasmopsis glycophila]VEU70274.1 Guanylate kinase [Mycoplasmopsis glycophila]
MSREVKKKNPIIIFSGPSGVGKGTIERLLFNFDELNLSLSCSATTRKKREGELDGVHYHFIDVDEFRDKIKKFKFLEFSYHLGNYYGTLYSELDRIHKKHKVPMLEIETGGAKQVIAKLMDSKNREKYNLITIFVLPPSIEELKRRIINRGSEDDETLKLRLLKAEKELAECDIFKYQIINDEPNRAAEEIRSILHKELQID